LLHGINRQFHFSGPLPRHREEDRATKHTVNAIEPVRSATTMDMIGGPTTVKKPLGRDGSACRYAKPAERVVKTDNFVLHL
jgi:hypothetical protein